MPEAYTIHILVVDGDPDGVKIVHRPGWTGWGIAFPKLAWPRIKRRLEFGDAGIYILSGVEEGVQDELPTVYIGQGDEIRTRIESHYISRAFWDWGYAFVSKGEAGLNKAHAAWLECRLIDLAHVVGRCRPDNATRPREPKLFETDRAYMQEFLREMLRILSLLNVRIFEKKKPIIVGPKPIAGSRDTIVVPAQEDGFQEAFIRENCWYPVRISRQMLSAIKYIAAYRIAPIQAVTHYAPVKRIEAYGDGRKYRLIFAEPAKKISRIPLGDLPLFMKSPRYTSLAELLKTKSLCELFGQNYNT
ncbi:MAG TPA: GIY-YIG nuclease family protein [Syntrophobacteraceae bacterium]|nr:GIY-YIG nuclease family protein [Syntrophobacteraceae bacterium]